MAGLAEWECVFESQFDFFGDLDGTGVQRDEHGQPDREEARQAWQRLGAAFLADFAAKYPNGAHFVPWAVATFGEPR
jgi:hypothetical protein